MLYRSEGRTLFVLRAVPTMLSPLTARLRNRIEERQSKKPVKRTRGPAALPVPEVKPVSTAIPSRPAVNEYAWAVGIWHRACYWWTFGPEQLGRIFPETEDFAADLIRSTHLEARPGTPD